MLQKIRDKISGWVAVLFLGAIAVVFIFWGIRFESSVTSAAAKVNGESIPAPLVLRSWQDRQSELQQQQRDELPPALVEAEQQKLLEEFIDRELLAQRARASGYRVSDRELAETLQQIPALQVDGRFSRDRYAALLRQQGRNEAEFEREFRRDLELTQLRNHIAASSFVTPGELRRRIELEGETRDVSYAVIPASAYADQVSVTPEQVSSYYQKNLSQFMTPETLSLQYIKLDLAEIAAGYAPQLKVFVVESNSKDYSKDGWSGDNTLGHALVTFETFGRVMQDARVLSDMLWTTRWMNDKEAARSQWYALDKDNQILPAGSGRGAVGPVRPREADRRRGRHGHGGRLREPQRRRKTDERLGGQPRLRRGGCGGRVPPAVKFREVKVYRFSGAGPDDRSPVWQQLPAVKVRGNAVKLPRCPGVSITVLSGSV